MSLLLASLLGTALCDIALGLYVIHTNPRGVVHRAFFFTVAGVATFVIGFVFLSATRNFLFDKCIHYGALLFVFGFLMFSYFFPKNDRPHAWWWLLGVPLGATALFIVPFNLIVQSVAVGADGLLTPVQGPFTPYYASELACYILLGVYFLCRNFAASVGKERLQFKYVFFGLVVFMVSTLICDAVLPAFGITELNIIGPFSSLIFVGCTAYAIIRHELMDIRIVIQRSSIYSALLAIILSTYLATVYAAELVFGTGEDVILISAGVTTVLSIFGVPVIERYFRTVTNRVFFKDSYDYASTMHALSEALHHNVEFEAMVHSAKAVLEHAFHPKRIEIRRSGDVILGPKRSGDPYTHEDVRLIETFSYQAAIAFERARLYDEVKHHAEDLEHEVEERTRQLRTAHDTQRQMMVDIAHNLQTPLTIFQTKLERLKATVAEREVRALETSLSNLSAFIYDLLNFAKLERETETVRIPIDLSAIVEEIVEEIGIIASGQGISVRSAVQPGIRIAGDARRIREACMNVASNSVKYMREHGEKSIDFTLEANDRFAILTIRDTGIGLRDDQLGLIFERFYRVDGDVSGSGLGLAIVKRVVEAHGGSVSAQSELGRYTAMQMRFPVSAAVMDASEDSSH